MYSQHITITIAVIVMSAEAGVITNASNPKFDTSIVELNPKLENFDKLSRPPKKLLRPYTNTDILNLSSKSWTVKNITRINNDTEEPQMYSQAKVLGNDLIRSEVKNNNNNLHVATIGDKHNNQLLNNDSVVEYLELDLYPNIFDEDAIPSTNIGNSHHITDSDDQILKLQLSNNTVEASDVKEKHIVNVKDNITNNEEKAIKSQNKMNTISEKENTDTKMTVPIKCDDKIVSEDEKKDFDEFIFINNEENLPEFATEINFDYFEIAADLLIGEPRFKRASNIIEEENLGTTPSGFKYTGRHEILNNNVFFKNINS